MPAQILLIDDYPLITTGIKEELNRKSSKDLVIDIANDFYHAVEYLKKTKYNVICLDLNMPSIRGKECFGELNGTTLNGWLFLKHYIFSENATYRSNCESTIFFVFSGYIDELKKYIQKLDSTLVNERTWFAKLNLVHKGEGVYNILAESILESLQL